MKGSACRSKMPSVNKKRHISRERRHQTQILQQKDGKKQDDYALRALRNKGRNRTKGFGELEAELDPKGAKRKGKNKQTRRNCPIRLQTAEET